jgi:hypothetical protein
MCWECLSAGITEGEEWGGLASDRWGNHIRVCEGQALSQVKFANPLALNVAIFQDPWLRKIHLAVLLPMCPKPPD